MELEDLKKTLVDKKIKYSNQEIENIFEIRTKRTVSTINKKMMTDVILMILTTLILVSVTFILGLKSKFIISGEIIGFSLMAFVHYQIKYRLLNDFNFEKNSLLQSVTKIKNRLNYYLISYKIIIPIFFSFLLTKYLFDQDNNWNNILELWPIISATAIISFLIVNKLTSILYGKELRKLKEVIISFNVF
jgi:hypothetical protein